MPMVAVHTKTKGTNTSQLLIDQARLSNCSLYMHRVVTRKC